VGALAGQADARRTDQAQELAEEAALRCLEGVRATLSATPATVNLGDSTTIRWSATIPSGCSAIRFYLGGQPVPKSGSLTMRPMADWSRLLRALHPLGERIVGSVQGVVILPDFRLGRRRHRGPGQSRRQQGRRARAGL
jgi:hypothetical protein